MRSTAHPGAGTTISIRVYDRFDSMFPKTQQGCAESYLAGIHDIHDDSVVMEACGSVRNRAHGETAIYRYHSDWYGDHLVAMIVAGHGYATVELWTKSAAQREQHTAAFERVVEGIQLK
ncbi:MAG TPA: hypothetical protein VGE29_21730 [Prosthecobacter sp.]